LNWTGRIHFRYLGLLVKFHFRPTKEADHGAIHQARCSRQCLLPVATHNYD
jgi:hypothetical protein